MQIRTATFPVVAVGAMLSIAAAISIVGWRSARNLDAAHLAGVLPKQGVQVYLDFAALRAAGLLNALKCRVVGPAEETRIPESSSRIRDSIIVRTSTRRPSRLSMAICMRLCLDRLSGRSSRPMLSHKGASVATRSAKCRRAALENSFRIILYAAGFSRLRFRPTNTVRIKLASNRTSTLSAPRGPIEISANGFSFDKLSGLPPGAESFLSPISRAAHVVFFVAPSGDKIELNLDAESASPEAASELAKQLTSTTTLLRNMLVRDKMRPRPDDLSGVLVGGEFEAHDKRTTGKWPLDRGFIESLISSVQ